MEASELYRGEEFGWGVAPHAVSPAPHAPHAVSPAPHASQAVARAPHAVSPVGRGNGVRGTEPDRGHAAARKQ